MNMTLEKNKIWVDANLLQQEILKNSDISRRPTVCWDDVEVFHTIHAVDSTIMSS